MEQASLLVRRRMKTPRAAGVAGIVFSILLITSQVMIWRSIPPNPLSSPVELAQKAASVGFALNLIPFAGVAFLWFVAVVRDRLGIYEDRFFATVLLGSGLLYIAMMFTGVALSSALIAQVGRGTEELASSGAYALGREQIGRLMGVFSTKMAAVFMFTTSRIFWRTRILPRPMMYFSYALAILFLVSTGSVRWVAAIFPVWVFAISAYILFERPAVE